VTEAQPESPGFRADQLDGFRIGVTSDRRSEDLIDAFRRRGAEVLHAPTLRMAHQGDDEAVLADTRRTIAERPDVLLATTSYGIRRWFEVADASGLGEDLLAAFGDTTVLVRGPKARGGVRAAGLNDRGMSERETTASLVDMALQRFPAPVTIAVQLHGYTDEGQLDRLRGAGHTVLTVAPYRWLTADTHDPRVERLIDAIATGSLDALTFTSAPAADALLSTAEALGRGEELLAGLRGHVLVAAVGSVTAAPLVAADVPVVWPDRFRMGALIRLVCERLEDEGTLRLATVHGDVVLRGSVLQVGSERVVLPPTPLALFRTLLTASGGVVARADLSRSTPGGLDDHALEVALSRLRQAVPDRKLIQTVIKRGYRIAVDG
jgi:uroporphyrinogen-III synthase